MKTTNPKFKDIERIHNYRFLGEFDVPVQTPLTDKERLELGEASSKAVKAMRELEQDLADHNKKVKGQIEGFKTDLYYCMNILNAGVKEQDKHLPCFYDAKAEERVFFDPDTGELIQRAKASSDDRQMSIVD